jgi:thiol peroxidase
MTAITLKGKEINTVGNLPKIGETARNFTMVGTDLTEKSLSDYKGKNVILNIFPSVNTGVCATSVKRFNSEAGHLKNTVVLNISKDLPFAQSMFSGNEGIKNGEMLSDFRSEFGQDYGVQMLDGPLKGLLSRAVIVIDSDGKVVYKEQVPEIGQEPDYQAAIDALSN